MSTRRPSRPAPAAACKIRSRSPESPSPPWKRSEGQRCAIRPSILAKLAVGADRRTFPRSAKSQFGSLKSIEFCGRKAVSFKDL